MIFFLHEKNENLNPFGSNLPHNAYVVTFLFEKSARSKIFNTAKMHSPAAKLCTTHK